MMRTFQNSLIGAFLLTTVLFISCQSIAPIPPDNITLETSIESSLITDGELVSGVNQQTDQTLGLYPLWEGSTWEYAYMGFDESQEAVWRVTETVVDTWIEDGYFIAELNRSAKLEQGNPPKDAMYAPKTGSFWYLVDGGYIYRFESAVVTDLSSAWLELILPLSHSGRGWVPDPDKRLNLLPREEGFRYASAPYKDSFSSVTYTCYNIATVDDTGKQRATFCEGVGFFFQENIQFDPSMGYRVELISFEQ